MEGLSLAGHYGDLEVLEPVRPVPATTPVADAPTTRRRTRRAKFVPRSMPVDGSLEARLEEAQLIVLGLLRTAVTPAERADLRRILELLR